MLNRCFVLAVLVSAILALAGCARQEPNRLAAEPPAAGMRSLFVTGHRYHSGIALRARDVPASAWPARADFPDAEYLDVGWGARDYYPVDEPGIGRGLRVLLTGSPATINVAPVVGSLSRAFPDTEIIELRVTDEAFARALEYIRAGQELDSTGAAIRVEAGPKQTGRFYASSGTFHLFENCNVWVARVLVSAGLPVNPGRAFTAGLLLDQVRPLSASR